MPGVWPNPVVDGEIPFRVDLANYADLYKLAKPSSMGFSGALHVKSEIEQNLL